jgi:hypothetical protein
VRFSWPPASGTAQLEIFDVTGARRRVIEMPIGAEGFDWDFVDDSGRRIPPGVYMARVTTGTVVLSSKVVLMP